MIPNRAWLLLICASACWNPASCWYRLLSLHSGTWPCAGSRWIPASCWLTPSAPRHFTSLPQNTQPTCSRLLVQMQAAGRVDTSKGSAAFFNWLADAGYDGCIIPATFDDLRGMMAVSTVPSGKPLLSFPRSATMDLATVHSCPCEELVPAHFWEAQPWYMQLALWLISEEKKGAASQWAAYIKGLPDRVDAPVRWSPEQLELLAYPPLIEGVHAQKKEFAALCSAAKLHLDSDTLQKLEPALLLVLSRAFTSPSRLSTAQMLARTKEKVVRDPTGMAASWARNLMSVVGGRKADAMETMVRSSAGQCKAMVPMLDLLNHYHARSPAYSYDPVTDTLSLVAGKEYEQGEQVFWSYGNFSNDHLLQYYGFSYSENPNDVFQLPSLSEWLEQQGMPGTRKGLERIGAMGILSHLESPKLLVRQDAAMRVSVEDGTLHAMRVFHDQLQSGSASGGESPAEGSGEHASYQSLLEFVQHVARQMEGSPEDDEVLLVRAQEKGDEIARTALCFRREKRALLLAAQEELRRALACQ